MVRERVTSRLRRVAARMLFFTDWPHRQSHTSYAIRGGGMSPGNAWFRLCLVSVFALSEVGFGASALAQDAHLHTPGVSGMPQGVPLFCANPTVTSVATGGWSNPKTWSTNKLPGANDRVAVGAGHTVTYDRVSDAKIE